jgi:hypothetical protein
MTAKLRKDRRWYKKWQVSEDLKRNDDNCGYPSSGSNEVTTSETSLKTDDLKKVDGKYRYCRPAPALANCYVAEDSKRVNEALYRVAELHSRWYGHWWLL